MELIFLIFVISLFSLIQSIFGIGLLIFGTPTLLIYGFSFIEALNILLLPSISISFLQVFGSSLRKHKEIINLKYYFYIYCIPFLIIGLFIVQINYENLDFKKFIGITLICLTAIRLLNTKISYLNLNSERYYIGINILIGIIHGITNMGGSFLSLFVSNLFQTDKQKIRYLIAYCYLVMGIIQLIFIQIFFTTQVTFLNFFYMIIGIAIFQIFGNKLLKTISNFNYQKIISLIIFIYGLILIIG
tara:strand:+ start:298 stop:1032 length:735 start_codon:yes stop_codon:yes gene_type:complete